jgi:hypothetical protein
MQLDAAIIDDEDTGLTEVLQSCYKVERSRVWSIRHVRVDGGGGGERAGPYALVE